MCTLKMQAHAIGAHNLFYGFTCLSTGRSMCVQLHVHSCGFTCLSTGRNMCVMLHVHSLSSQFCFDGLLMGLQSLFSAVLGPASLLGYSGECSSPWMSLGKDPIEEAACPLAPPEKEPECLWLLVLAV